MHVDRSLANRTELTTDFQNFITRYAWGEIWTRDGLTRHTRSLITIAMMVALNRSEELALHLRAAKNNGVTQDQIKEVLLANGGVLRRAGGEFRVSSRAEDFRRREKSSGS